MNKMIENVKKTATEKRFPPWFLCSPGPPNHTLSADTMKWQYHQVMNIRNGLEHGLLFLPAFL